MLSSWRKNLISQEVSGRVVELEEIQNEDTPPSEITSEIPMEVECFEPPQEELIPVHRSVWIYRAPERLGLNVEVKEHGLGDLNEPTNYKATMLDPKSNKWLDAMNAEIQSMKDNQVWRLVDLPPNCKTIMDNSNRGNIPMQEKPNLNKTQGASTPREVKRIQNVPYDLAGFIMYAVRCTRHDVAFVQNITSIFQQNPRKPHSTAVKTILKYLRNTKDMFLVYGRNPEAELRVDCYCNAGFETDIDKIKSLTGYVFVWNGNAID
ncbi:hypothetical protein Tco_0903925 [Tanacetum coccineum]